MEDVQLLLSYLVDQNMFHTTLSFQLQIAKECGKIQYHIC